jgi:hypothetical protein
MYREDLSIQPGNLTQCFVENSVLAKWYTSGLADGLYEIKFTIKASSGDVDSNIVRIELDNTAPTVGLTITNIVDGTGIHPALPCGSFKTGCEIKGTFSSTDEHFNYYTFVVEPHELTPNSVTTDSVTYTSATGHVDGSWTLKTAGMQSCGYVIHLYVYDRTIVNSGYIGWRNHASVGFCLTT